MTPTVKIRLIKRTETARNENGYPVWEETSREVWAEEKGPNRAEFYAAQAAGVAVSGVFTVYRRLYLGEELLECRGQRYRVLRAYPKSHIETELTCTSEKVDQNGEI